MSYLKDIVVELHNCLHEFEPEDEMPMVWSREFQQRLAQNASHWNDSQRRASHVSNMDFQDEQDADIRIPYDDDYSDLPDIEPSVEQKLGAVLDFDVEEEETSGKFKTKWGEAFRRYLNAEESGEEAPDRHSFLQDLTTKAEEEEEDEGPSVKIGGNLNITDDPEKVEKAKRLRDRARKVRDEAKEARGKAKDKQAGDAQDDSFADAVDADNDQEWENPDLQGTIRAIPNAHLVYKRQQEDGTFDELWHYNIGEDFKRELKIRRAVLAGTDIPINKMKSPDGNQTYELWTIGNGQMLKIQGLPN